MSRRQTIFALSSGQVPSGIAVVRVSGPQTETALRQIIGKVPSPRQANRAVFRNTAGDPLDDGLVLWFPAPSSATGEDVAEFHCHGGRAVIAALFAALGALDDLRPAEPGEFSLRAFENGKLDLVAAEALDDLIHADTEQQRRQSLRQLQGLLGDRARDWRQRIIDVSALVEAGIDFSDEGDVADSGMDASYKLIASLHDEIVVALAGGSQGERLREGLSVVIAGPPNVGKSTLLNCLARRDVAIVSPHPGTTRDVIEVALDLGGYPVTLIDTAGLREASDAVEREGIRRARARAAEADLVLQLTDGDEVVAGTSSGLPVWTIYTKADLGNPKFSADFSISAVTGDGIDGLATAIARFAAEQFRGESGLVTRARHRVLLQQAIDALGQAERKTEPELVAEYLRVAATALGRLLGRVDVEDVLGAIFSRFCIGK